MSASIRFLLLSLAIFILGQTVVLKSLRNFVTPLVLPIEYGMSVLGQKVIEAGRLITSIGSLRQENFRLIGEVEDLRGQVAYLREAEEENSLLRSQLSLVKETGLTAPLILADVVGRDNQSGSYLLLNRGERDGVTVGSAVIYKKFLLGEVAEVSGASARVRTIFDSQFRVPALSAESVTRTRGLVRGEFSTSLLMEKILPVEEVERGQTIITSGEGGFPRGLVLGLVKEVSRGDAEILKWARLSPLIDLSRVDRVFVVKE
ncbi:MAG: rod shape-determining protein MreC [Patescibacteria group bacterium]